MGIGNQVNGLYHLDARVFQHPDIVIPSAYTSSATFVVNSAISATNFLLHKHLGHVSLSRMQLLLSCLKM